MPVLGRRLNEYRNKFTLPEDLEFPNILSSGLKEFDTEGGENAHDFGTSTRSVGAAVEVNTKRHWCRCKFGVGRDHTLVEKKHQHANLVKGE